MDNKIFDELKKLNETMKDLFIFLMSREGFGQQEIRTVFGKIDCARITKIASGIKKVEKKKTRNNQK